MKEKQWIHVKKKFGELIGNFNKYYSYSTFDEELGEVNAYVLLANSSEHNEFISLLNKEGFEFIIFRREYTFTKKEKENAEILKLHVGADGKDSFSPKHDGFICDNCNKHVQYLQIGELFVKYKNIKKYDICVTYMGDTEIIISERLKNILISENVTGIKFSSIYDIDTHEVIKDFYHLQLEIGIGEVIEPAIVEKDKKCKECGFYGKFLCQTPLYFEKGTWKELDMSFTYNWFGSPPITQGKWVIISQRLYRILKENNIKHIDVQPAFLV